MTEIKKTTTTERRSYLDQMNKENLSDDEKIELVARYILEKYRDAIEALAKC